MQQTELARQVFDIANAAGMSRTDLARRLGMTRSHIWRVEKGKCGIGLAFALAAKRAFPEVNIAEATTPADPGREA